MVAKSTDGLTDGATEHGRLTLRKNFVEQDAAALQIRERREEAFDPDDPRMKTHGRRSPLSSGTQHSSTSQMKNTSTHTGGRYLKKETRRKRGRYLRKETPGAGNQATLHLQHLSFLDTVQRKQMLDMKQTEDK